MKTLKHTNGFLLSSMVSTSRVFRSFLLCIASVLTLFGTAWAGDLSLSVKVENKLTSARIGEVVAVPFDQLRHADPSFNPSGMIVIEKVTGKVLPLQICDAQLLFQSDIAAGETKTFIIKKNDGASLITQSLVDGRFVKPREDYAWENDRIAFRMYGPALAKDVNNGIDVWTKRVRSLIVEKWYKGEEDTGAAKVVYHIDHGEGADFFNVGRTLGCGSSALWCDGKLYQPGVFSSWRTLANGPLRVSFELTYNAIVVNGKTFTETRRITLDAGQNLNRIDVLYSSPDTSGAMHIVAGLVKRKGVVESHNTNRDWMGLWGPTNDDPVNGSLGTGIVLPGSGFNSMAEDSTQFLALSSARVGEAFTYYAGAGWTRSGDFAFEADWKTYLAGAAARLQSPLIITVTKSDK
jgi:hypothetical protein